MLSSKFLKEVMTEAYPIIERQINDAKVIASFRDLVTTNGGDWSALKALMKAHVEDSLDDSGDGKRVRKILDKADSSNAYAEMLGLANMNEKNFIAGDDEDETEQPNTIEALLSDASLGLVRASDLKKATPTKAAGSDLANLAPHDGQVAPNFPDEPVWQSGAPADMERHPYSEAFGAMGQDLVVIADDVMKGRAAPIVMLRNKVLDGWARFQVAIGAVGLTGQSTEYQVVQYDGDDALIDCIKWNIAGRMLSDKDKQTVAQRLIAIEPKRRAEILKAVAELAA